MAFTDGMVVPTGTTANVTTAASTYLFQPLLATLFQVQVIEIVVVLAAVAIMWFVLRGIWHRFCNPAGQSLGGRRGWDGLYYASGMSLKEYERRKRIEDAIAQNNTDSKMLRGY